jgi:hypothetical protein
MNKFVLQIIQNLHITIERVYLRIEDPYPFALGILIPSVTVRTADSSWQVVQNVKKPEIAYKIIRIEDFSIFMERDAKEVSIDAILDLAQVPPADLLRLREERIYQHLRDVFAQVQGRQPDKIDDNDYLLKKLTIDVRLQMTIDKVRVQNDSSERGEPDIKVSILCGGLFDSPNDTN